MENNKDQDDLSSNNNEHRSHHSDYNEHRHHSHHGDHNEHRHHSHHGDHNEHRYHSHRGEEHRGHTSHRSKKKRMAKPVKISIIAVSVVVGIIITAVSAFFILKGMGYKSLYSRSEGKAPNIDLADINAKGEAEVGWKDGWVRNNGKIYEYNENILTFLIMGIDNGAEKSKGLTGGQADANFLLVLNPDTQTIQMICINRDTMTDIDVYDSSGNYLYKTKAQLALQHAYGINETQNAEYAMKAVSDTMYNLPIHGYCAINMDAIPRINDSIGGVTLICQEDLSKVDKSLSKGAAVNLVGKQAYNYVHYRDTKVFESNRGRLARQKQYLGAFINKAKSAVKKNPTVAINLYNNLSKYMATDITLDKVTYLASIVADYSFDIENVMTLEGETKMGELYEEFYPDENGLQELILKTFYKEVVQ